MVGLLTLMRCRARNGRAGKLESGSIKMIAFESEFWSFLHFMDWEVLRLSCSYYEACTVETFSLFKLLSYDLSLGDLAEESHIQLPIMVLKLVTDSVSKVINFIFILLVQNRQCMSSNKTFTTIMIINELLRRFFDRNNELGSEKTRFFAWFRFMSVGFTYPYRSLSENCTSFQLQQQSRELI